MQTPTAIIFDLGGVLLNIDYNLTLLAFKKLGIENFGEMYSQAAADDLFKKLETGEISEENFYKRFKYDTGTNLTNEQISNAWNALLLDFRESSLDFLNTVKNKYRLFLLSNTNHIHLKEFTKIYNNKKREKQFVDFFEKAYFSCNMNLRKPDIECFEQVLHEENLQPNETIFIDDSVQNIDAARITGMHTILLEQGRYIEELNL